MIQDINEKFPEKTSVRTAVKLKLFENGINVFLPRIIQAKKYMERFFEKKLINLDDLATAYDLEPTKTLLLPNRQPEISN